MGNTKEIKITEITETTKTEMVVITDNTKFDMHVWSNESN